MSERGRSVAADARVRTGIPAPGEPYRHTQFGTRIVIGTVLGLVLATLVIASLSKSTMLAAPWLIAAVYAVLGAGYVLFYRLTVTVDAERVLAVFGVGLLRKEVALEDIRRVDVARTRVWWGFGIHWTQAGWLYNVGGRWVVRLELVRDRPVMIGTDEPEVLAAAIDARLAARRR
jgi:hypothetical protein